MEALALPYESEERPVGSAYFFRRLSVQNYKSIGKSDIALHPLTLIVGRNGSGKSNLLDALRFVAESLQTSLEHAIKSRGGIDAVRRKSAGHPRNVSIEIEVVLPGALLGTFGFEVVARRQGGFVVGKEYARTESQSRGVLGSYVIEKSRVVRSSIENLPPAFPDRLYLVSASGFPAFRPLYDALSSMGFYNLNPESMKQLQPPDAGEFLHRDGSNIASVMARLAAEKPEIVERIKSYLATIVPGIQEVERVALGPMETLQFKQEVVHSPKAWNFYASSISDGTLRALGTLAAVTQLASRKVPISLVGIEEPETALHPAAAGALMDALREASSHTQILVTSHSPDLLDSVDPETDGLLVVRSEGGETHVAPADPASRSAIRDHLYTAGELLRMDQLEPDRSDLERQDQMKLFPLAGSDLSRLRVAPIVEGVGEELAVRILLQRLWTELLGGEHVEVLKPIRLPKSKLVKSPELRRTIDFASRKLAEFPPDVRNLVLVMMDADEDLPSVLGPRLLQEAREGKRGLSPRRTRSADISIWARPARSRPIQRDRVPPRLGSRSAAAAQSTARRWINQR